MGNIFFLYSYFIILSSFIILLFIFYSFFIIIDVFLALSKAKSGAPTQSAKTATFAHEMMLSNKFCMLVDVFDFGFGN